MLHKSTDAASSTTCLCEHSAASRALCCKHGRFRHCLALLHLQGTTTTNYFVVVVEIYYFWQATVAYMYFTTPTHSARATSCNMLAQGHPFARRVFISPGLFLQGVKSIQVHWIPVSLIYMHSCVSLQISVHWLWKDCLQNWRKKKSNNESWEGARVSLHFLVCPLMFPAYALHGNREEESNHNSITALMIV